MLLRWMVLGLTVSGALAGDGGDVRVELGDGTIDGTRIRPYRCEWTMTEVDAGGAKKPVGRWTDRVELIEHGQGRRLRRTQASFGEGGEWSATQVHVVEHASFAPIRSHYTGRRGASHTEFAGPSAHGAILPDADQPPIVWEGRVARPVFDFNLAGLLIATFPLAPRYAAILTHFELEPRFAEGSRRLDGIDLTLAESRIAVNGREMLETPAGTFATQIVETGAGSFGLKFWIASEPPYVIRLESARRGKVTLWELDSLSVD